MENFGKFSKKTQIYWESSFCKSDKEAIIKDFQRRKDTFCQKVELLSSSLFQWKSHFFHEKIVFVNMSRLFSQEICAENRHQFLMFSERRLESGAVQWNQQRNTILPLSSRFFSENPTSFSSKLCLQTCQDRFHMKSEICAENQHQFFSLKIEQFNVFRKKTWKWNFEMASRNDHNFVKMWWLEDRMN